MLLIIVIWTQRLIIQISKHPEQHQIIDTFQFILTFRSVFYNRVCSCLLLDYLTSLHQCDYDTIFLVDIFCIICIILTFLFSSCRLYRDRQKPPNKTQCSTLSLMTNGCVSFTMHYHIDMVTHSKAFVEPDRGTGDT